MSTEQIGRRELLALFGVGAVGAIALDGQSDGGTVLGAGALEDLRTERYRPVVGGVSLSAWEDTFGTLGIGVEDVRAGRECVITNRHVVDDGSDEQPEDVVGRPVYQPQGVDEADRVGEVLRASSIGGAGSSDWAVVELDDAADWSTDVLGLGSVGDPTDAAVGDRIVMAGARTGLVGGEVTRIGIDANFRGELYTSMIEYVVDENRETAGNSGALVCVWDDATGALRPVGLHTFGFDEERFAIPISDVTEGGDVQLVDGGADPEPAIDVEHVEASIVDVDDQDRAVVLVANVGGTAAERTVRLRDPDGTLVDGADVSLGPLETTVVRLDREDVVTLEAGQTSVEVDLSNQGP